MRLLSRSRSSGFLVATLLTALAPSASAGGGPMNVLVLFSQDDTSAIEVAEHYAALRQLPQGHLCGLRGFAPDVTQIDVPTYQTKVQAPLDACLAALPHPELIDYVVLVRGLPYLVVLPKYTVSLEAMVQVGHTTDIASGQPLAGLGQPMDSASVPNPVFGNGNYFVSSDSMVQNQYSAWYGTSSAIIRRKEQPPSFRRADVPSTSGYAFAGQVFVVQSLDGFDYEDAKAVATRGAASDGTMPSQEILCMRGEDEARAARDPECELATRMLKNAGLNGSWLDAFDGGLAGHDVMAYFTGSADTVKNAIAGNTFAPGAIACNLTSFGAAPSNFFCSANGTVCPASEAQTSIARFIRAGASGAHGTANEPYNNVFPNAGTLLFYTFGYNMGESFLFNQRFLYWQNIHVGDPLATPYATRPAVTLSASTKEILVTASHDNGIARIDLYAAGARIGQVEGASELVIPSPGAAGASMDLLAVAVANNVPVTRAGWNEPDQQPHPDVQGWRAETLILQDPIGEGGGGAGGSGGAGGTASTDGGGGAGGAQGPADPGSDCACRATAPDPPGSATLLGLVAATALFRLRRRSSVSANVGRKNSF